MKRLRTRKGAPGIVEVAKRAGVSPATVSRFYNSPDVVKLPTRKRIEQAAQDLGYIRDRAAGMLHGGFSGTIGLVVPTIDNAIFAELIQAFASRLEEHGRTMLIAAHGYDLSKEVAIIRSLLERRIDGVALIGLEHQKAPLEMLASRNVPVLAVWNFREDSAIPCIGADNFEAGRQVAQHLTSKGHKDIALLFPPLAENDRSRDRLDGVLSALETTPEVLGSSRLIEAHYNIGLAKSAALELLKTERPTAMLCGNDIIAQGAVYACQKLGLRIPDDISIIGIGDFRGSAHMEPALTTIRMPARQIGEAAADSLCRDDGKLSGRNPPAVRIPTVLMERESVGTVG